jgi:hypothetical protein
MTKDMKLSGDFDYKVLGPILHSLCKEQAAMVAINCIFKDVFQKDQSLPSDVV